MTGIDFNHSYQQSHPWQKGRRHVQLSRNRKNVPGTRSTKYSAPEIPNRYLASTWRSRYLAKRCATSRNQVLVHLALSIEYDTIRTITMSNKKCIRMDTTSVLQAPSTTRRLLKKTYEVLPSRERISKRWKVVRTKREERITEPAKVNKSGREKRKMFARNR